MAPQAPFGASPGEFAEAMDAALALTPQDRARLREDAKEFSWHAVYERFCAISERKGIAFP